MFRITTVQEGLASMWIIGPKERFLLTESPRTPVVDFSEQQWTEKVCAKGGKLSLRPCQLGRDKYGD